MITERLTDQQRRRVLQLLLHAVPAGNAPDLELSKLISIFSGTDTVVSVDRAYPSAQHA